MFYTMKNQIFSVWKMEKIIYLTRVIYRKKNYTRYQNTRLYSKSHDDKNGVLLDIYFWWLPDSSPEDSSQYSHIAIWTLSRKVISPWRHFTATLFAVRTFRRKPLEPLIIG